MLFIRKTWELTVKVATSKYGCLTFIFYQKYFCDKMNFFKAFLFLCGEIWLWENIHFIKEIVRNQQKVGFSTKKYFPRQSMMPGCSKGFQENIFGGVILV